MTRCYACSRVLTNPESISLGIGPICRARRKRELDEQEKLDREAGRCHFGFNCGNPIHVGALLERLMGQVETWPEWLRAEGVDSSRIGVARLVGRQIDELAGAIVEGLGLRREPVDVPEVPAPGLDEMLKVTGHYMNPVDELQPGQYRVPADIQAQYRRTVLREMRVCPHGLDCIDPGKAVGAVYGILSLLRNEVEPLFRDTYYGGLAGASDASYTACMNMLEVMGLHDEASFIQYQDMPKLRKAAARNARRWERRQARVRTMRLRKEAV